MTQEKASAVGILQTVANKRGGPPSGTGATEAAQPQVEVKYEIAPVQTNEQGVTWVGNIGMTSKGLIIPPEGIGQQEWQDFFNVIQNVKTSWQLIVGDWVAYGNATFQYTYEQIAAMTGYTASSIETFGSVCRNVPWLTRVNSLLFAHYRVVAKLPPERQILALKKAEENGWSARQLREFLTQKKSLRLSRGQTTKSYEVIDKKEFKRLKKADPQERARIAAELRRLADELDTV